MAITTIDEYLATVSPDQRVALEHLRATIKACAPDAEECISYRLPAFRQRRLLVGFGATPNHCAFYLLSSRTVEEHADLLEGFSTSKGTIRFTPDKSIPDDVVRTLVKARIVENS